MAERQVPEAAVARLELAPRFDLLRGQGLTIDAASAVLGLARATYCRWRRRAQGGVERLVPRSRRPLRPRRLSWPSTLVQAVQRLRDDLPMWGQPSWSCFCAPRALPYPRARSGRFYAILAGPHPAQQLAAHHGLHPPRSQMS
jgi:hypothetical protein